MTHALADAVAVDEFRPYATTDWTVGLSCPTDDCGWHCDDDHATLGALLAAARRHILDEHPGRDSLDRQRAYTRVVHAVDAMTSDGYPALIAETELAADPTTRERRRCAASGRTVRGPLLPVERPGQARIWVCRKCFAQLRRNVAHLDAPLALTTDQEGGDTRG